MRSFRVAQRKDRVGGVAAIYREVCLRVGARVGLTAHARNSGDLPRKSACKWVHVMALLRMRASASEQVDAIGLNEQRVPETREETCVCSVVCNAAAEGRALRQAQS